MIRAAFFIVSMMVCVFAQAQKTLQFHHAQKDKTIEVKAGEVVFIGYAGYMGQLEYATGALVNVTDSTIEIGTRALRSGKQENRLTNLHKIVRISDIVGFRKRTVAGAVLKATLSVGVLVGSYFLVNSLYSSSSISNGSAFVISLGIGLGSTAALGLVFPEKTKYRMSEGWKASAK